MLQNFKMNTGRDQEISSMFQAQCHIYRRMYHYIESMCLKSCVQLGIADIIHKHSQPVTLPELVSELEVPQEKANCLERLMRILVHSGFFAMSKVRENQYQEGYVLTSPSKLLLKDSDISLNTAVLGFLESDLISPWFSLGDWFKGSDFKPFEPHHGVELVDCIKGNHGFIDAVNKAMASDTGLVSLVLKEHKEIFEGLNSVLEVGGGSGTLARTIADAFPRMKCIVFDLPHVVAKLQGSKNLTFVAGDMFHSIPSADAILIKSVLYKWNDEDCIRILKNCREAIPGKDDGGKLILVEMVINEKKDEYAVNKARLFVDMQMMLASGGRGRNENDWKMIFQEAGFRHYKVNATTGLFSIIEVYP